MEKFNAFCSRFHEKFMSINFPTVNNCCCCLDLRTAGLVVGVLGIIADIIFILSGKSIVGATIGLIFTGCWVYGILHDKPNFMFGKLISDFIGLILIVIFGIIQELLVNSDERLDNNVKARVEVNVALIIVYVIIIGPVIYQWIVSYSLYKSVLERHNDSVGSPDVAVAAPSDGYAGV